jgi:hypothetical protein
LEGILCIFTISGDAVRIPDKPSRVRLAQCGEGFGLPLLCCRYQGVFAHCRPPGLHRDDEMFLFCEQT